jgi:hypothetical protein
MKIRYEHTLSFDKADKLIEKYYDGLTTAAEEKELRSFLSQPNLPEQYKVERDILGFFEEKKKKHKPTVQLIPFKRWSSVAAVLIVGVFCIKFYMTANPGNYAYVDGKKITDVSKVKQSALASLNDLPSDEVADGLNSLNENSELIDQQLSVFTNN